jgi:effector-binding domain-containing protein
MSRPCVARSNSRLTLPAVLSVVACFTLSGALAQTPSTPPATPPASPAPSTVPAATPSTPAPAATPAPDSTPPASATPAASSATPATPPASGTTPPATPPAATTPSTTTPSAATPPAATPAPATPPAEQKTQADPFGEEITLTAQKVVMLKGKANWDAAFETITGSLKTLATLLEKQKITATGPMMVVYTSTDDSGFTFIAEIPVAQEPKNPGKDISIGQSPEGRTLKFVHRGSYDNMDNTYEAITNHLDDKKLEARDTFIEEYVTDPLKTAEDKLVINVFVPLK